MESDAGKEAKPILKSPYNPPRLVVYGELSIITEGRRKTGDDGGVAPSDNST